MTVAHQSDQKTIFRKYQFKRWSTSSHRYEAVSYPGYLVQNYGWKGYFSLLLQLGKALLAGDLAFHAAEGIPYEHQCIALCFKSLFVALGPHP